MLHDDAFGVGEALNEMAYGAGLIARGKHYLMFGKKTAQSPSLEAKERLQQLRILMSNWLFFDDVSGKNFADWRTNTNLVSSISELFDSCL